MTPGEMTPGDWKRAFGALAALERTKWSEGVPLASLVGMFVDDADEATVEAVAAAEAALGVAR